MPYLFVVLVVIVAAYLSWRLVESRMQDQTGRSDRSSVPRGPDDDPDFLRRLDER
ncbi:MULTISPECIES: hypothetical protein [Gordonia]|uniref:Uncharacterized protein n=2 Tax=Gordonia TaxID=2053 RepID=L7LGE8_9ACTN|nr:MULTISPECIES: hypothetical protein [Gordonia]WFN93309.1 hypothetical protein P5P27_01660 [Gordonia sihwensis]GAC59167.1 hypothetical protein GSI01S_01_01300 [Gordonia sihwensis NBRC 108236]